MAILKHELWIGTDGLPGCCLAGQAGEEARRLFAEDDAKLVWTFEASCHFEAMAKVNQHLGREPYASNHLADRDPYPAEWLRLQQGGT